MRSVAVKPVTANPMRRHTPVIALALVAALAILAGPAFGQAIEDKYAPQSFAPQPEVPIAPLSTAVLFDSGPLYNSAGTGAGGANESVEKDVTFPGMITYGWGVQNISGIRMADDFMVTNPGWNISTVIFYLYQTNSTTTSTITALYLQIWRGRPGDADSTIVWGDLTTNRLASSSFCNTYRVLESSPQATSRPIMATVATVGATLTPGTYWLDWTAEGSLSSGPWQPPVAVTISTVTGNARQTTDGGTTWADAKDNGSPQGVPFTIQGTVLGAGAGDFNGDGKSDLVWRNTVTGQNALWLMNGTSVKSIVDLPALPNLNYVIGGVGDFNGDGRPDIVWRNQSTGQNAVWLMNGTALSTITDLPSLPNTSYVSGGIGDFNADGMPDILWRNQSTGQNAVWLMNGTSLSSVVDFPALSNTNYVIGGVGDFNWDGKTDVVWRNKVTGQNALWLMNGTSLSSLTDLPALANANYVIGAIGYYNADGQPDIVWRNTATGQNAVWLMNGTSVSAVSDLPALPNLSYKMSGPR